MFQEACADPSDDVGKSNRSELWWIRVIYVSLHPTRSVLNVVLQLVFVLIRAHPDLHLQGWSESFVSTSQNLPASNHE